MIEDKAHAKDQGGVGLASNSGEVRSLRKEHVNLSTASMSYISIHSHDDVMAA